ncbi:MAG: hypothetical protein JWL61_2404 [Gemmatimonadetes bacterium]|nr:hypothetical protein [Gemmatimonadota bacterium]
MKRIVWTFGLISGAILSLMMAISMAFIGHIGDKGMIIGYTTMVVSFLMVFVGIKTYRDNVLGGSIGFVRAFQVGILIAMIGSMCYVATWEVLFYGSSVGEKVLAQMIEKEKTRGANQAENDANVAKMRKFHEQYHNPFINSALTFIEAFPVGLVITLVSAGVLSRKRKEIVSGLANPTLRSS